MPSHQEFDATVILPVKNSGTLFEHVLAAIAAQKGAHFEVLIIDSGSKDGTLERSKKFLRESGLPVRLYQIPAHEYGHGKTRNLAASLARGKVLVYLTHDASPVGEDWLATMLKPFADERVAVAFGPHLPRDNAQPLLRHELLEFFPGFSVDGRATRYATTVVPGVDRVAPAHDDQMRFCSNVNAAYRRSAWQACNFRDVSYAEDQLMAQDLLSRGWIKVYQPDAKVLHSNQMPLISWLPRYVDEWQALHRSFGHTEVKRIWHLPLRIARRSLHALRVVRTDPRYSLWRRITWIPRALWLASAREIGGYIGPRIERWPAPLARLLSRDARLRRA
jgi:glycosyltransferase involved in cell wall biosynthesis